MEETIKKPKARTTRFSGADWAEELDTVLLVGVGGIGSWTALNLSRIGHELVIFDGDSVDETNVHGGQMFTTGDIKKQKVLAVYNTLRSMGCVAQIDVIGEMYQQDDETWPITITGLDNMAARKLVFDKWENKFKDDPKAIFIDGRLLMENMQILTIQGGRGDQMEKYRREFLFDDSEVAELDCTTKQSTFSAMIISGLITATLCNFLTNRSLGAPVREVPFEQKLFLPIFKHDVLVMEEPRPSENIPVTIEEIIDVPTEEPLTV